jgi:hypothetical protein
MKITDINTRKYNFSNDNIYLTIKHILKNDFEYFTPNDLALKGYNKLYIIADLLGEITDENLLNNSMELLCGGKALVISNVDLYRLSKILNSENHTVLNQVKISSLYYSEMLIHQTLKKQYASLFKKNNFPDLIFNVMGNKISINSDEIQSFVKRKCIDNATIYNDNLTLDENRTNIKIIIKSFSKSDYVNGTKSFKKDIKYLKRKKQEIESESKHGIAQPIPAKKTEKTLLDFISNVQEKEAFLDDLKSTFNTESGIDFKIMIELLKEQGIFIIGEREFFPFYRCVAKVFDRNIGTRAGLNDFYKHTPDDQTYYNKNIKIIKNKLNPLVTKHKVT